MPRAVSADTYSVEKPSFASVILLRVRWARRRLVLLAVALLALGACAPLAALEIYRPENYGALNTIPCLLRVTDLDGNDASAQIAHLSYNWYYELPLPNWSRQPKTLNRYFNGCFTGGVVLHLLMKPGKYLISVYTPVDKQQDYAIAENHASTAESAGTAAEASTSATVGNVPTADASGRRAGAAVISDVDTAPREWRSNTFAYDTAHKPRVIFVSPTANDNGFFNGGWHIDYKAPQFYQYTKPAFDKD